MAEQLSNIGVSTLKYDISDTDTSLEVQNALSFPTTGNFRLRISTELMLVTDVVGAVFTVTRGIEDTDASSHDAHDAVYSPLTKGALIQLLADAIATVGPGIPAGGTTNQVLEKIDGTDYNVDWADASGITPNQAIGGIWAEFDNYGAPLVADQQVLVQCNVDCTILAWTIATDAVGSIVIEVRRCTYAQYDNGVTHPVTADKINATNPPTVSSADKATDSTLTGWTTSLHATEFVQFVITSVSGLTYANILLGTTKP